MAADLNGLPFPSSDTRIPLSSFLRWGLGVPPHFQLTFSLPVPANLHVYSCLHFVFLLCLPCSLCNTKTSFNLLFLLHHKIRGARSFAKVLNYLNGKKEVEITNKLCWNKLSVKSCSIWIQDNISNYVSIYYFPTLTFLQAEHTF